MFSRRQFSVTENLPYVEAPGGEEAVELRALDVEVVVNGLLAETTQTMRFFNPNRRDLEGNVVFPLPDDAAVCGYALDVDGELVDGVVVPKQEARRILEAEERKGVDPGLVEHVQGNIHRTRIYPIPARGTRTVKITYVGDLTVKDGDAAYHLPLAHADKIGKVSLRIEVVQPPVEPSVSGGIGNLTLDRWGDRWVAEATLGRGTPSEDLQVRLPKLPEQFTTVERSAGEVFFCISRRLSGDEADGAAWTPGRLAIAWDASGSRTEIDRDLSLLEELSAACPELVVDVVVFRNQVERDSRVFDVGGGRAQELIGYLRGLPYDGGTCVTGLDLSRAPHEDDEAWLLFSDGLGTVRPGLPEVKGIRVFCVTSQASCDAALMSQIARQSGGVAVNLLRMAPPAALHEILGAREALRIGEATGCADLFVDSGNGRLSILGRLTAERGSVKIIGAGAPAGSVIVEDPGDGENGQIIARAWAGRRAQAVALTSVDPGELVSLGRRFGLVTPGTSLLVLESLEQYLEYDIEPPATLPRMREAFRLRRRTRDDEDKHRAEKQIDTVLDLWRRRIEWWERDFHAERRRALAAEKRDAPSTLVGGGDVEADEAAMGSAMLEMSDESCDAPAPCAAPAPAAGMAPPAPAMRMAATGAAAPVEEPADDEPALPSISIRPWSPDTPYLSAMKRREPAQAYRAYLDHRPEYSGSPAFFLDCGDFFLSGERADLGVRVLSNLVELGLDDPALMRMYAWRLQQAGELDLAIAVLERVRAQREDEPQSHRDLALALGQRWERDRDGDDAIRAMKLLYDVVLRQWDRFPEIEIIALMELNRLLHLAEVAGVEIPGRIDRRLRRHLDLDIRISMSWDADLTDVDLHVFEPTGEHAYYGHNLTQIGGMVSRDFTQGYGPEEYVLRRAAPGIYAVKAHYYGSSQQSLTGPCTVTATVFTDYGREREQKQVLMLRLDQPSDEVLVGEITIDGTARSSADRDEGWRDLFRELRRGMTLNEITARVGQPAAIEGEAEMILIYRPAVDVEVHVIASPRLAAVQQIMDGARLDLI